MKKLLFVLALLVLVSACGGAEEAEPGTVRIAAMRGPTAFGLLGLMDDAQQNATANTYDFTLLGSPDEVPPLLLQGAVDVAVVPGNLAAVLYNRLDGELVALSVVTLGVLHIVDTTGEIGSIADLRGRTVYLHGQGATPEFALNYVLEMNGLTPGTDVTLEFRAEHAEIAALLAAGQAEIALLPEPFVSTVLMQQDNVRRALDLTEEWNRVQPDYGLIMSVVVARRQFVNENPSAIEILMREYAESIGFVNANIPEAADLAVHFDVIPAAPVARAAIPGMNLVWVTGGEMQASLTGFYNVLHAANPQSVGGALPSDAFFFIP
jgi:NitT/TauT family transport system substrate-binding protein